MKAEELRVGNLITTSSKRNTGKPFRVEKIQIEDRTEYTFRAWGFGEYSAYGVIDGSAEPIPLNEEWLIKLGMNKGIGIHNDMFSGFITANYNDFLKYYEFKIGHVSLSLIKYVHQLQNLYFALTGEELLFNQPNHEHKE